MSPPPPSSKRKPAPPRPRRPDARPDEILDAALAVFADQGFDAARMEDVAQRAAISKAGVYLYFPSKEVLLEALIERETAPIAARVAAIAAGGTAAPLETLALIANFIAGRLLDPANFRVPRLMLAVAGRFPDIAAHYREHVIDVAMGAAMSLIHSGIAQGVIREIEPRAAVRAFIGPILFEVLYAHVLRGTAPGTAEQIIAQHVDVFLNGIAAEKYK